MPDEIAPIFCCWIPTWVQSPPFGKEVVVKVAFGDGTFKHDIGTLYEDTKEWGTQFWDRTCVVAWAPLPVDNPAASMPEATSPH